MSRQTTKDRQKITTGENRLIQLSLPDALVAGLRTEALIRRRTMSELVAEIVDSALSAPARAVRDAQAAG